MSPTKRVNHLPGREITPNFLNRLQDPPRFDGADRNDYWNREELRSQWGINQRCAIADYEIDQRSSLAATTHHGLIKGADVDPVTNIRLNVKVGAPRAYLTSETPPDNLTVEIYGGTIADTDGNVYTWSDLELNIEVNATSFGFVDSTGQVLVGSALPSRTTRFTPLFKVITGAGGITNYQDLRPQSHLNYFPANLFILLNTPIKTANYTALPWERVLLDSLTNSFTVRLPLNPADGDRVAFVDVTANLSINSVLVNSNGKLINNLTQGFTLDVDYLHISFVYCDQQNSWFIESTNAIASATTSVANPDNQYRKINTDYTLAPDDYRRWIDIDSSGSTKVVTLPVDLAFGFETQIQSIGGITLLVSNNNIDAVNTNLNALEAVKAVWVDNRPQGGDGIWKILRIA